MVFLAEYYLLLFTILGLKQKITMRYKKKPQFKRNEKFRNLQ